MGSPFEQDVTSAKIAAVFWSHAFILFGIFLAYRCREWVIMVCGICVLLMSTTYHLILLQWLEMKDVSLFWVGDYTTNYNLVLAVEMYLYKIKNKLQAAILSFTPIISIFLGALLHRTIVMWVLLLMYFGIFFFVHSMYMVRHHNTVWVINTRTVVFTIFMILYLGVSIFFLYWAGNPGGRYYFWPHVGGWHTMIFIGFDIFMLYVWYYNCEFQHVITAVPTPVVAEEKKPVSMNMSILPTTMVSRTNPPPIDMSQFML